MTRTTPLIAAAALLLVAGCNTTINRSLRLHDGESHRGGLTTVNGSVHIGSECRLAGAARTVNGRISVGDDSEVETLQAVNGGISVGRRVRGDVVVEDDDIRVEVRIEEGSEVRGKVRGATVIRP